MKHCSDDHSLNNGKSKIYYERDFAFLRKHTCNIVNQLSLTEGQVTTEIIDFSLLRIS